MKDAEMEIELISEEPVYHRPYRLSLSERQKVKRIIAELIFSGIIQESRSPFASPILLINKKNGEVRLCVDYRALNKITKPQKYPLPLIDDQIDQLKGKWFYTSLDLKSGFYQIPMSRESVEKTAFITPDGQYEFLRMPFGLMNAPAVYQREMDRIFRDLAHVYIDDILIATDDVEKGFRQLEAVLLQMDKYNLTLNLTKCEFFAEKIEYLGREISAEGVRPGQYKTGAIQKAPEPRNYGGTSILRTCRLFPKIR